MGKGLRVQQLRLELANCKQKGQPVVSYYGRLKSLWDELNSYDPIPVCSCTGCKCNLNKELERRREEEKVHQFLMGLDEEAYGATRSNILSEERLPNLNRSYAMVIKQERTKMAKKRDNREMPEDKRTRDAKVVDVDYGDSILILSTCDSLLILDLNGKQRGHKRPRHKPSKTTRIDPIVLKVIDFESNSLPEDMSLMRLGDKGFFVFGGIKWLFRDPFEDNIKTNRVYKLNPDNNWSLELTKEVKHPDAPIVSDVVEEVNGKIFVLQVFYEVRDGHKPRPIFDVYDIASNTWSKISTKNSWSEDTYASTMRVVLDTYFLLGCRMYIVLKDRRTDKRWYFCFNTNTFGWEEENASNLRQSLKNFGDTIYVTVCVSRIQNLDDNLNVIMLKQKNGTMISYLINDSGCLVCFQDLSCELYSGLDIDEGCDGISLINHKSGGGRMCLVIRTQGENEDKGMNFVIRHFELKLKEGFEGKVKKRSAGGKLLMEREFLTVEVYKNQRCRKTGFHSGMDIQLRSAFFF